jgi:hypothetical protein
VTGLTNNKHYSCTVAATNDRGTSATSGASNVIVPASAPATVPRAPGGVTSAPFGNGGAKVSWKAPANGGSAVTGYRVTPYLQGAVQPSRTFNSLATTQTLTGLHNGRSYQFTVDAINVIGHGAASAKTAAIIVGGPGAPGKPNVTKVAPGSLKTSWTTPANNGASITLYTVTCKSSNGGVTRTKSGKSSPMTIGALTVGKSYTCRVTATNSRGTGPSSATSAGVRA